MSEAQKSQAVLSSESADAGEDKRSGATLVMGIILFALVMGLSGLSLRAYVRLRRGEQTSQQVLAKLASAGLYQSSTELVPLAEPLPKPLGLDLDSSDFSAGLASWSERIFQGDLRERQAGLLEVERLIDSLQPLSHARSAALVSSSLLATLARVEAGEGLTDSYKKTLARGLRSLAEKDSFYESQGRVRSLFGRAQVADARATFIRVLATALEASHHDLPLALGALKKTDEVVQKQRVRVAESLLLVFPELGPSLEIEGQVRSRCAMLRLACQASAGPGEQWVQRIEAALAKSKDPLSGAALRLSTAKDGHSRLWSIHKHEIGLQLEAPQPSKD